MYYQTQAYLTAGRSGRSPGRSLNASNVVGFQLPWLSLTLIAALALVFIAEQRFSVGQSGTSSSVSVVTLLALGGLNAAQLSTTHEWYRLLTAPFLHLNVVHLLLNTMVLLLIGPGLERLIGRAWLAVLYLVSALGGSLASAWLQAANVTSVGASGAIMGLLTASIIVSHRLPQNSRLRSRMKGRAAGFLVPSLLPLGAQSVMHVDYYAHFGGAFTGCVFGFIILGLWPKQAAGPRFRAFATGLALVGGTAVLGSGEAVALHYPRYQLRYSLIPINEIPAALAEQLAAAPMLLQKYPNDPRAHAFAASGFLNRQDMAAAEHELREAIRFVDGLQGQIAPAFIDTMHAILAWVLLNRGQLTEAKAEIQPVCNSPTAQQLNPAVQKILADPRLCNK